MAGETQYNKAGLTKQQQKKFNQINKRKEVPVRANGEAGVVKGLTPERRN